MAPVKLALETHRLCGSLVSVTLLDAWPRILLGHRGPVGWPAPVRDLACPELQARRPSGGPAPCPPLDWLAGAETEQGFSERRWGIGRRHTVFSL